MSNIDLSKYVGKNITAELRSGGIICAPVFLTDNNEDSLFKYSFCGVWYAKYGYFRNEGEDDLDIVKILEVGEPTSVSEMVEQNAISLLEARGYKIERPFILDFDWDCLPKWANKYISMNVNGDWCSWGGSPYEDDYRRIWMINASCCYKSGIPSEFAPKNFTGDWKDSLFKNPNIKD